MPYLFALLVALHLAAACGYVAVGDPTALSTIAQIDAAFALAWLDLRRNGR
ncbi:hypothetical protein [Catenuloplanes japonicus]|uniref:hypothetical protein n=1 Tax=Catenuloplanes japonicus TaxID=33876 RepID=UPI000AC94903|nr:hypothetical protein [Catenuloplanes japonicus]